MDDQDIRYEIKKAIGLFKDATWNEEDLQARILQLISEAGFRKHLESYMGRVMLMRQSQVKYWLNKDQSVLGKAKGQEAGVDKVSMALLKRLGITSAEEFLKRYQQTELF